MAPPDRRTFLTGLSALGLGSLGITGCGSSPSISEDPDELVMWYWNRSASPELLEIAAEQIPGTGSTVRADIVGTDFDTKLRTSLAGGAYIPDITFVNDNNALYFRNEQQFIDMDELGASDLAADYYEWKWELGRTPEGRLCFFPLDIGPTGFYFRQDVFDEAGLPSTPDDLAAATATWEDWLDLGRELRAAADVSMITNGQLLYTQLLNASAERYLDESDQPIFLEDGSAVRTAWDIAVTAIESGVTARIPDSRATDQNAGWSSGRIAGHLEAAWWTQILEETAPDTAGAWRLASMPVRPGNSGGSFAAIPRTCKDPEAAFAFITWLNSPENQASAYNDVQLFPSAPASYEGDQMEYAGDFFGDQDPLDFFSHAAEQVPTSFISTWESIVSESFNLEITNVEASGKDPERAWRDAVDQAQKRLNKRGVTA